MFIHTRYRVSTRSLRRPFCKISRRHDNRKNDGYVWYARVRFADWWSSRDLNVLIRPRENRDLVVRGRWGVRYTFGYTSGTSPYFSKRERHIFAATIVCRVSLSDI